jgi:hypothetical protein
MGCADSLKPEERATSDTERCRLVTDSMLIRAAYDEWKAPVRCVGSLAMTEPDPAAQAFMAAPTAWRPNLLTCCARHRSMHTRQEKTETEHPVHVNTGGQSGGAGAQW